MSATTRPRGGSRALIAGLIVAAVIAAGLLARIGVSEPVPTDDEPEPIPTDEEPDRTSTSRPQSPAGDGAALPGGFARDEEGAVAAAIAYTAASQRWLYLNDDEIAAAVAAIAAPQPIERLTREVLADVQTARRAVGGVAGAGVVAGAPLGVEGPELHPVGGERGGVDGHGPVGGRCGGAAGRVDDGHGRPGVDGRRLAGRGGAGSAGADADDRPPG